MPIQFLKIKYMHIKWGQKTLYFLSIINTYNCAVIHSCILVSVPEFLAFASPLRWPSSFGGHPQSQISPKPPEAQGWAQSEHNKHAVNSALRLCWWKEQFPSSSLWLKQANKMILGDMENIPSSINTITISTAVHLCLKLRTTILQYELEGRTQFQWVIMTLTIKSKDLNQWNCMGFCLPILSFLRW